MVRINLNPFGNKRAETIARINSHFQSLAIANIHREQDWKRKREVAQAVLNGGAVTPEFSSEARLRNMDEAAFAELVLSKPDPVDARALARQQALLALDKATTLGELSAILESLNNG